MTVTAEEAIAAGHEMIAEVVIANTLLIIKITVEEETIATRISAGNDDYHYEEMYLVRCKSYSSNDYYNITKSLKVK